MTLQDQITAILEMHQEDVIQAALDNRFYFQKTTATRARKAEQATEDLFEHDQDTLAIISVWLDDNKPVTIGGQVTSKNDNIERLPAGRYLVTAAQNNTAVHDGFLTNLKALALTEFAQLQVMPIRYTTQLDALSKRDPYWVKEIKEYLLEEDAFIGSSSAVKLATSANLLPTVKMPMNAAAMLNSGEGLTIVASTKRQIKTLPRPKDGGKHRWVATTGVCTLRHYTDTRAGAEASESHVYGALLVNVSHDGSIEFNEITANEDGDFVYEMRQYHGGKGYPVLESQAMVLGDLHCEKMCAHSWDRTIAMVRRYRPATVVLHDTYDQTSRNHHNLNSGKFLYTMGDRSIIDDLIDVVSHVNEVASLCETVYLVQSNHDLALDRLLDSPASVYDPAKDPVNAKTYHFLKYCLLESIDNGEDIQALELAFRELREIAPQLPALASNVVFGNQSESYKIAGVELSQHGHHGNNGARGSANAYKGYRLAMVTGHTHAPLKDGDLTTVGVTGSLDMGYNLGGTSWDRAHAIIDALGIVNLVFPYKIGEQQY